MDNTILRKKLSAFKSAKGTIGKVNSDVLMELLRAWELWTGPTMKFYQSIGISHRQAARILGMAKKLQREGGFATNEFSEIKVSEILPLSQTGPCSGIELLWDQGKVIRFPEVGSLIDFLKKVA